MISNEALLEFKQIWKEEFGEEISDKISSNLAVNLLTIFNAIYRPIKREWINKKGDENANNVENQPISASCKPGAEK